MGKQGMPCHVPKPTSYWQYLLKSAMPTSQIEMPKLIRDQNMTLFLTLPNGPDLATIGLKIVGNMKLLKIHSDFFYYLRKELLCPCTMQISSTSLYYISLSLGFGGTLHYILRWARLPSLESTCLFILPYNEAFGHSGPTVGGRDRQVVVQESGCSQSRGSCRQRPGSYPKTSNLRIQITGDVDNPGCCSMN